MNGKLLNNNISYKIDTDKISSSKMQLIVINRCPKYGKKDMVAVKAGIEKELYEVFRKYV